VERTSWKGARVYTIGHSTRALDELVALLAASGVEVLADVRTVPRSRRNPQFNSDALRASLAARGIRYEHLAKLGGLRHARKDSQNTAWRNASFRGYADYMQTPDFEAGLDALHELTRDGVVAMMCAEAVPWRCHRSLVADALSVRGADVRHIVGPAAPHAHRLTSFARVDGERVTYPGAAEPQWSPLATAAPFHLEATVRVLQRRPSNPVELWRDERYERVFRTAAGLVLATVENRGSVDAPDLQFTTSDAPPEVRASIEQALRRILGLDVDPAPLAAAAARLRSLERAAPALRGMRPPRFAGFFDVFVNVVPFQQLSLDAGAAILGRLVERFGETATVEGRTFALLPTAEAIAGARLPSLTACGLSRTKAESLRSLAKLVAAGELVESDVDALDSRAAAKVLTALPGIGPWSAAIVLLRGFGRLDVFPPGDSGAQRSLNALLRLRAPTSLERVVRRFGPYRGYLYFLGLGSSLLEKGLIRPADRVEAAAR
jgi:3-methyladenine DNA glycosylase/8-oxoguanine DNA glycosylase